MGYEGQNFVKTEVNQCYILILLVWLQKFELFCPGLEYPPHTVVLNQAMDFFQACISFRYLVLKSLLCNRRELDSSLLHSNYADAHTQHNKSSIDTKTAQ